MLWAFWGPETYLKHCVSKSGTLRICWVSWLNHMICCCKIWEVPNLGWSPNIWLRKGALSLSHWCQGRFLLKGLVVWLVGFWRSSMECWQKLIKRQGSQTTKHQPTKKKRLLWWYPPKFNSSRLKSSLPDRKGSSSNHAFFRGELLNFGGVSPKWWYLTEVYFLRKS